MSLTMIATTAYHVIALADRRKMVIHPDGSRHILNENCAKMRPLNGWMGFSFSGYGDIEEIQATIPAELRGEFQEEGFEKWVENIRDVARKYPQADAHGVKLRVCLFGIDRFAKPGCVILNEVDNFEPEVSRSFTALVGEPFGKSSDRLLADYLKPAEVALREWKSVSDENRIVELAAQSLVAIGADFHATCSSVGPSFDMLIIGTSGCKVRRYNEVKR